MISVSNENKIKVLKYLKQYHKREGWMPTMAEISGHMGWKSTASAHFALKQLESEGQITTIPGQSRAIRICG